MQPYKMQYFRVLVDEVLNDRNTFVFGDGNYRKYNLLYKATWDSFDSMKSCDLIDG